MGSRANTWEVADSFNWCTYFYNKDLRPEVRNNLYRKLTASELLDYGNYNATPLINIDTFQMEWWILDDKKGKPNG